MERIKRGFTRIREHQSYIRKEIVAKTATYLLAALGFVVAFAWNDAIKSFIEQFFPSKQNSIAIKFFYAISVTILIVVVTVYFVKSTKEKRIKNK